MSYPLCNLPGAIPGSLCKTERRPRIRASAGLVPRNDHLRIKLAGATGKAISLRRWATRLMDDGLIEVDNNTVERSAVASSSVATKNYFAAIHLGVEQLPRELLIESRPAGLAMSIRSLSPSMSRPQKMLALQQSSPSRWLLIPLSQHRRRKI